MSRKHERALELAVDELKTIACGIEWQVEEDPKRAAMERVECAQRGIDDVAFILSRANGPGGQPTLRDQFAMAALTGVMSDPEQAEMNAFELAVTSYQVADSMIYVRGAKAYGLPTSDDTSAERVDDVETEAEGAARERMESP